MSDLKQKPDEFWRERLSESDYRICRLKGTERPFTGKYNDNKSDGTYYCKCCGEQLFDSQAKYDSGSGWPSFYQSSVPENIDEESDHSHGMIRTEVMCAKCGSHLGHVFPDGPQPTGMRYCINSASLNFEASDS